MKSKLCQFFLTIIGIIAFVTIGITLENQVGIPFSFILRLAGAGACLFVIAKIGSEDHPGERWPKIALFIAFLFNVSIFFSPLSQMPASKGDITFFAVPDAVIFLAARTFSYPATDVHQRAVRQQLIVGLILASALCAIVLSILLVPPPAHPH